MRRTGKTSRSTPTRYSPNPIGRLTPARLSRRFKPCRRGIEFFVEFLRHPNQRIKHGFIAKGTSPCPIPVPRKITGTRNHSA